VKSKQLPASIDYFTGHKIKSANADKNFKQTTSPKLSTD